jgi:urate oxidase
VGADGQERLHPHSFYRDGDDKRITKVEVCLNKPRDSQLRSLNLSRLLRQVDASAGKDKLVGKVTSGIADLLGKFERFLHQST